MRISADGTEYQIVIAFSESHCTSSRGRRAMASSTSSTLAPDRKATYRSKTERSKWKGAWLESRSDGATRNSRAAHSTKASALRCEIVTPLGVPVEPEV